MLSLQISDIKDFMSHLYPKIHSTTLYFISFYQKWGCYQIQGRINGKVLRYQRRNRHRIALYIGKKSATAF